MQTLKQYFPDLTESQLERFERLQPLYQEWNARINVISRQDIENLETRHILHSLAIARIVSFRPGAEILDLGTGGGFPGIPLAILFPEVRFTLIDGTGKKITVVREVAEALGLDNVIPLHCRAEMLKKDASFDFVVTRAVASLDKLYLWSKRLLKKKHVHSYPNGVLALKGGNLSAEIAALPGNGRQYTELFPITDFFSDPWFEEKWVVYVQG
ncbi:MAG: 16S rRNA (guanine(527)-N(7))-methyltransferase RsmG [Bacteroidetes bacterium]|nr:MAG: 16S rRNA (guanine(527)-N(7))-methyltransferase RsmG [Bacteroidota bacterium]